MEAISVFSQIIFVILVTYCYEAQCVDTSVETSCTSGVIQPLALLCSRSILKGLSTYSLLGCKNNRSKNLSLYKTNYKISISYLRWTGETGNPP